MNIKNNNEQLELDLEEILNPERHRKLSQQIKVENDTIIRHKEQTKQLPELKTHQDWIHDQRARKVESGETVFGALRKIDYELVSKQHNSNGDSWFKKSVIYFSPFGRHVPYGYISVGDKYGNPKIFSEGYYFTAGYGCKFGTLEKLNKQIIKSQDNTLTILTLKENDVAIIANMTETKICYGPCQYVLLEPWTLVDKVLDLKTLERNEYEFKHEGSTRALAFHIPQGEFAIVQTNNKLQIFEAGYYVIAEQGIKLVQFVDIVEIETTREIPVKSNNTKLPVILTLRNVDPIKVYMSKRENINNLFDEIITKIVNNNPTDHEEIIKDILQDDDIKYLSWKYGIAIRYVIIGS